MSKLFIISYEMKTELDIHQLWPDGDAPDNPSCEDVRSLIEEHGGIVRVIKAWNLDPWGDRSYEVREIEAEEN